jgi:hypothetical protein
MKLGKEVSYLRTKVGQLDFELDFGDDIIIIETKEGTTEIYSRKEYETFSRRNEKISKLLDKN